MVVQFTREFCSEMLRLTPRYIHFPRSRRETAAAIEQLKVFCQCRTPNVDGKADYFSRKQRYTTSTQGFVGANLVFLDVATGFLGSCHDALNFRNTSLYTQAGNGEILTKPVDVIENSQVRLLVLGDGTHIKPFNSERALTSSEKLFLS